MYLILTLLAISLSCGWAAWITVCGFFVVEVVVVEVIVVVDVEAVVVVDVGRVAVAAVPRVAIVDNVGRI